MIDVLFYIPLKVHILIADDLIAVFLFNIPFVYISSKKKINRLKNKISPISLKQIDSADIKYIEAVHIKKIFFNLKMENISYEYYPYLYPFIGIIQTINRMTKEEISLQYNANANYKFYCLIEMKLAKLIEEHILVRRIKNERTSTE